MIFGLILIAAQLIWKSIFISNYFFWQDDFHFTELALGHSFTWSYLTYVGAGHLFPGVYAIVWVVSRIALYNWAFASAITVIMLAAAGLAALRLLRTLFGDRPAILVLLLIYLLCPLTMLDLRWWSTAMELLPLQIAVFMALNAQVYYVRTGRFRHAIAVAAWLVFGLIFFEKALILPLVLLGVTSGFLMEGPWPRAIARCLVKYWKSWVLQVLIVTAYAVVLSAVAADVDRAADGLGREPDVQLHLGAAEEHVRAGCARRAVAVVPHRGRAVRGVGAARHAGLAGGDRGRSPSSSPASRFAGMPGVPGRSWPDGSSPPT